MSSCAKNHKDEKVELFDDFYKYIAYYPNDSVHQKGYYSNNEKTMLWLTYDNNGKITKAEDYSNSKEPTSFTDFSELYFSSQRVDSFITIEIPSIWEKSNLSQNYNRLAIFTNNGDTLKKYKQHLSVMLGSINDLQGMDSSTFESTYLKSIYDAHKGEVHFMVKKWYKRDKFYVSYSFTANNLTIVEHDFIFFVGDKMYYFFGSSVPDTNADVYKYFDIFNSMFYSIKYNGKSIF